MCWAGRRSEVVAFRQDLLLNAEGGHTIVASKNLACALSLSEGPIPWGPKAPGDEGKPLKILRELRHCEGAPPPGPEGPGDGGDPFSITQLFITFECSPSTTSPIVFEVDATRRDADAGRRRQRLETHDPTPEAWIEPSSADKISSHRG